MANTLATPTWVTKETTRGFVNEVKFIANVNRRYDDQFIQAGAKVGYTIQVRLPQRFTVTDGQALSLQNIFDQTVAVTLTNQKNVAFGYSAAQATAELDMIRERYVQPAAEALANAADVLAYSSTYKDIYSFVGTIGTTPNAVLTYLQAGVKLSDLSAPVPGRVAVLDTLAMMTLAGASATLFNPPKTISENYKTGLFASEQLGIAEWYQDQNRPSHTSGTFTSSTPVVNGANQTGTNLITSGWANGATTLNKGDIFVVAGVNTVNPLGYQSTGRLQQFVVTATTSDSAGAITIPISPGIVTSGQTQTVDASPANNAIINVWNTTGATYAIGTAFVSPQSLVFHPDAFTFVMADLVPPGAGARSTTVRSKEYGIAIRMVEQYQIATDQNPSRLDFLAGAATLQARLACRVVG